MLKLRRAARRSASTRLPWAARSLCDASASGPDPSRHYDIKQYEGLWHMLTQSHEWPHTQTIAVLGPVGREFQRAVEVCCGAASGCSIIETTTQAKSRWQSVRVSVRCLSPDDFCELHFRLSSLHGVKAVV